MESQGLTKRHRKKTDILLLLLKNNSPFPFLNFSKHTGSILFKDRLVELCNDFHAIICQEESNIKSFQNPNQDF